MGTPLRHRPLRLGARLFASSARMLRWVVPTFVVLTILADLRFPEAEPGGWWPLTINILMWFVAVTAGLKLHTNLSLHLSQGVTRSEYIKGYAIHGLLVTAAMTALATAGFVGEHALMTATGSPEESWGGALAAGLRYLVVTPIYFFAGAAIGALGTRYGGNPAAVLGVVILPAGAIYAGTLTIEFFELTIDADSWSLAAWAGGSAALIAVLIAAYALTLRTIPLRPKAG